MNEESLRVTSVNYNRGGYTIFSGVPLQSNSYKIESGRYIVSVKSRVENLPVIPAVGQHWSVRGKASFGEIESNGYKLKQHTYEDPEHVFCSLPETGEQLIRFIAKEKDFKGVGESKARALWDALGKDFHRIARKETAESRKALRVILSEDSIDALFEGYAKYTNLAACNKMSNWSVPSSIQQRLLKYHSDKTLDAIKDNPYSLIGFGLPFKKADEIASNICKVAIDDPRRLSAALEIAIRKQIEKGHTYTTQRELKNYLKALLGEKELVKQAFIAGHDKAQYLLNSDTGYYHPTAQLLMENVVSKRLIGLSKQKDLYDNSVNHAYLSAVNELPYELTSMQVEAVITCLDNSISCISGGAGTGKTTVLRTVLRAYNKLGYKIHAVALSGRAAMRLHESVGFVTSTIAKLLHDEPIEPTSEQQKHLLVIDEASMIDLPTMYRLVNHIHPSVIIIFTGDPDQLPPIGCGKVLADIVTSKAIENTMLDIVKRQDGSTGIPEYSKLINAGVVPEKLTTGNIVFHEISKHDIAQKCCDLYMESPENSRVMAPTKVLVTNINKLTQNALNLDGDILQLEIDGQ